MNFSTLIGFAASAAIFIVAMVMSTDNIMVFADTHALLIVVGGTMAASLVCFSMPQVLALFKVFARSMLGQKKHDYNKLVEEIAMLSRGYREGRTALTQTVAKINDPFLRDAAGILSWLESDVTPEELRTLLETRASTHYERYLNEAEIFRTMAKFPPAFGLMGTTLGMISLLQSLGAANAKSRIGPAMSIALVATLYGIVLANFVFTPIAENLAKQTQEDLTARKMVVEGVMSIVAGKPTAFVVEHAKSFLLPSERDDKGGGPARPEARPAGGTRGAA
jgi:chemotaxis protein MotA